MSSAGAAPKKITSFRDLIVWQRSMDLIEELHPALLQLPREELFALNTQIRKSALSIPSNISEGHDRRNKSEFLYFLGVSRGSLAEFTDANPCGWTTSLLATRPSGVLFR